MSFFPYFVCALLGVDSLRGGLAEGNRISVPSGEETPLQFSNWVFGPWNLVIFPGFVMTVRHPHPALATVTCYTHI